MAALLRTELFFQEPAKQVNKKQKCTCLLIFFAQLPIENELFQCCLTCAIPHYHIWTPRSWLCVWMWRRCTLSSAAGRQVWWWASGGICRMGSPKNTAQVTKIGFSVRTWAFSNTWAHSTHCLWTSRATSHPRTEKHSDTKRHTSHTQYIPVHFTVFMFPSFAFFPKVMQGARNLFFFFFIY